MLIRSVYVLELFIGCMVKFIGEEDGLGFFMYEEVGGGMFMFSEGIKFVVLFPEESLLLEIDVLNSRHGVGFSGHRIQDLVNPEVASSDVEEIRLECIRCGVESGVGGEFDEGRWNNVRVDLVKPDAIGKARTENTIEEWSPEEGCEWVESRCKESTKLNDTRRAICGSCLDELVDIKDRLMGEECVAWVASRTV